MARIEINDDYALKSDPPCWILIKKPISKGEKNAGEVVETPIGYHTRLARAAEALLDYGVRVSDANGLEEALRVADDLKRDIERALQPLYKVEVA